MLEHKYIITLFEFEVCEYVITTMLMECAGYT